MRRSWAILPAAKCLFGKSKVSVLEASKEWSHGTIVICKKENGQFHFIAGAGEGGYAKVGDFQEVRHDQTGAYIGTWEIVNELVYKTVKVAGTERSDVEMKFSVDPVHGVNYVEKAGLHVFK